MYKEINGKDKKNYLLQIAITIKVQDFLWDRKREISPKYACLVNYDDVEGGGEDILVDADDNANAFFCFFLRIILSMYEFMNSLTLCLFSLVKSSGGALEESFLSSFVVRIFTMSLAHCLMFS